MNSIHGCFSAVRPAVVIWLIAMGLTCSISESRAGEQVSINDLRGLHAVHGESQPKTLDPFAPFLYGKNACYMVQAYFPKDALNAILPNKLSIPDDATMLSHYPDTMLKADAHPFTISFCHGSEIHDMFTNIYLPEQEEILFLFPVMYTDDDGETHLCSYVPVLYLDSFLGVVGGLFFSLRKEYHPEMEQGEDTASRWWRIGDILDASFEMQTGEDMAELPGFFKQTYANPYVTISYPLPFSKMVFFQIKVNPETVLAADETFEWNYKGTTVKSSEDTLSAYSEYWYTLSWPMKGSQYFGTRQ